MDYEETLRFINNGKSASKQLNIIKSMSLDIISSYNELQSIRKVTAKLGVTKYTVKKVLKENNIILNSVSKKKEIDSTIFDIIDSEEKAYWLGFLYADGYLDEKTYGIRLELGNKDLKHLELFKTFLKSDHIIRPRAKPYTTYYFSFSDLKITKALVKSGLRQNKSLTMTFPTNLNKDLVRHFIRGYFDGDGCIYTISSSERLGINILGTENFLRSLEKTINIPCKIKKHSTGNIHSLWIYKKDDVKSFCNYIYKDQTITLPRKYQKYIMHTETSTTKLTGPKQVML